jgi:hypothetical protein
MRKVFAESKVLVLVTAACATALLLGAGCPAGSGLDLGTQTPVAQTNRPTFQFTAPAARVDVTVGSPIGLSWTDSHPAGDATIRLFFDHDGSPNTGDETTITMLNEAVGTTSGGYAWNTTGMAMGVYRLAATIDDHTNTPVTVYLAYEVVIRAKGTGGGPIGNQPLPTLTVQQPATLLTPQVGSSVMIRWTVTNPTPQAKLYLYYDVDKTPDNLNEQLIAVVGPGTGQVGSNDYGWTIPLTLPNGIYYILARLSDGQGTDLSAYAPGTVQIGSGTMTDATRDLSQVGITFPGAIFDGYVPNGRMGEVMAGGKDFNADTYPDIILVGPQSSTSWDFYAASYPSQTHMGEAYLVYARGKSGRWPQGQVLSMGNLGALGSDTQGVQFIGPAYSTTTSGIQEVLMIDDRDGDGRPEIVFGIPDVDRILEDQQDYDPLDSSTIHNTIPPARPGARPGFYYFKVDGWQEYSDSVNNANDDWLMEPGEIRRADTDSTRLPDPGKRSGMIIYVSGGSNITNQVVLLDEVGGRMNWARTRIAKCDGMRLYPIANSDTTQWGSQLAAVDLFAQPAYPALLVARPADDGGVGSVKILRQDQMSLQFMNWTKAPAAPATAGWIVQPATWSFPAADTDNTNPADPDRLAAWPTIWWNLFMDNPASQGAPPSPIHFSIMTSNTTVGANGHLGHPTNVKDFNHDSIDDVAVSAPDASPGTLAQAGMAYVIAGSTGLQGADVSSFGQGGAGMSLAGTQAGEQLGWKMAGPGDFHGDGYADCVLTAPNRSWSGRTNCGAVVLVPGRPMPFRGYTLDDVIPTLGGAIIYGQNSGDHLGMYMVAVGDADRDNYPDFVVSAPNYSAPGKANCGAVYLIYGGPHLVGEFDIANIGTPQLPGKMYIGSEANAMVGPVAAAGDVDQDYYADFLIGYPGATPNPALPQAGRAWLIYGSLRRAP